MRVRSLGPRRNTMGLGGVCWDAVERVHLQTVSILIPDPPKIHHDPQPPRCASRVPRYADTKESSGSLSEGSSFKQHQKKEVTGQTGSPR